MKTIALLTALAAVSTLAAVPAHAGGSADAALDLTLDGVDSGFVRATTIPSDGKKSVTITAAEPTRPLIGAVRMFLDGKAPKKGTSLVLSTGAVVQKVSDARLVDVRLPSYAGNANELLLTFEAASSTTSPSLRAASDRSKPVGTKLAGFRLTLADLPVNEATRLDAISIRNKEGAAIPGAFSFDVPSKDAPAFLAWSKKGASSSREGTIEYVSSTGEAILTMKVTACTATSAKIDGPVTHVAVTCARVSSAR